MLRRRSLLLAAPALACPVLTRGAEMVSVAYAGSMGTVMDQGLGPAFTRQSGAAFHGQGEGAYALARLIAGRKLQADVFVSITAGPVRLLQQAGMAAEAVPVASTEMAIAYSPASRFAEQIKTDWVAALSAPGLRFGRTDPHTDPQGRNIIFTLRLAEIFYKKPGFAAHVLGEIDNPAEIFTEPSLLSRLDGGQIDASSAYRSMAASRKVPFVALPAEINLGDPAFQTAWYQRAAFSLDGKTIVPEPLVFYALVPTTAANPAVGRQFVGFLASPAGQAILRQHGYGPPRGGALAAT